MYYPSALFKNIPFKSCFVKKIYSASNLKPIPLVYREVKGDPCLPPLVILHGLFGNKNNWFTIAKVLRDKTGRTMISVDQRNHGESQHSPEHSYPHMAEDLKFTLQSLKIRKVALLGHSMGGRTVMYFALKYPDLVEKLIVADMSPVTVSPQMKSMEKIFTALEEVKFPTGVPMSESRRSVVKQLSEHLTDSDLVTFLATNVVQKQDSVTWAINIKALKENFCTLCTFPKIDEQYQGSTLFLAGQLSDYILPDQHEGIYKIFPNSKITYIKNARHWLHVDKPEEFIEHCKQFLHG